MLHQQVEHHAFAGSLRGRGLRRSLPRPCVTFPSLIVLHGTLRHSFVVTDYMQREPYNISRLKSGRTHHAKFFAFAWKYMPAGADDWQQ